MATWKKITLVNLASVAGAGLTLFLVPPSMPFWLWLLIATVSVAMINYVVLLRSGKSNSKAFFRWKSIAAVVLFLLFVLDLLYGHYHR